MPGEQLPSEVELAGRLAVAPMTLRQAIAILREAGLVETRRGKHGGTFVSMGVVDALGARGRLPGRAALQELTDWRRAVSGEAAALAAERIEPPRLVELEQLAAEVDASGESFESYRLADSRFHVSIAAAAQNARLVAAEIAIQNELGHVLAAVPESVRARRLSAGGHDPILAALRDADAAAARAAMQAHVRSTFDWVVGLGIAGA